MSDPKHLRNEILKIPPERFNKDFRYMIDNSFLLAGTRFQEISDVPYGRSDKIFVYKFMSLTPLRLTTWGSVIPSTVHAALFSVN